MNAQQLSVYQKYWDPIRTHLRLVVPMILLILIPGFEAFAQLKPAPEIVAWDTSSVWSPLKFLNGKETSIVFGYESMQMRYFWAGIDDSLRLEAQVLLPFGGAPRALMNRDNQMIMGGVAKIDSAIFSFSTEIWDIGGVRIYADTGSREYSHLFQRDFLPSEDGGWLIAGIGRERDSFKMTPVLAKFSAEGEFEWEFQSHNNQSWSPIIIHQMEDGMIFLLGHDPSDSIGKVSLTMLNPQGDSVNTKYIYPDTERPVEIVPSYDKGMFLVGTSYDSLSRNQVFVQKIDAACDPVWRKHYLILNGDSVRSVNRVKECISTWDGGMIISLDLSVYTDSTPAIVPYLMKLDKFANPQWEKVLISPTKNPLGIYQISQTPNGAFLLGGYIDRAWPASNTSFVGLLSPDGSFPLSSRAQSNPSFTVYPNPALEFITVSWSIPGNGESTIRIFDVNGKEYFRQTPHSAQGQHDLSIPFTDAATGIYLIELSTTEGTVSRKIIKR